MRANNVFAWILLKNKLDPKQMFLDKKKGCYCVKAGNVWWRYYIKSNLLGISQYEKIYTGYSYESSLKERLYQVYFDNSGNISSVINVS